MAHRGMLKFASAPRWFTKVDGTGGQLFLSGYAGETGLFAIDGVAGYSHAPACKQIK